MHSHIDVGAQGSQSTVKIRKTRHLIRISFPDREDTRLECTRVQNPFSCNNIGNLHYVKRVEPDEVPDASLE